MELVLDLYPSLVEVDCGCIGLVEFGTPVFGRPFVASVEVVLVGWWSSVLRSSVDHLYCLGGGCIG